MATIVTNAGSLILNGSSSVPKGGYVCKIEGSKVRVKSLCGEINWDLSADTTINGNSFADTEELLAALSAFSRGGTGPGTGVQSVSGDGVSNTDPSNPVISWPEPSDIGAAPATHTHTASQISDSSAVGRSVLTAASAAEARAAIGAGTSNLALGTTASTAAAGNHTHAGATGSTAGFMSAADKTKLDNLSGPSTYYISASGNNANDGLTPATAWADFDNTETLPVTSPTQILLKSGDTFTGSLGFVGKTAGILISTYGGEARATINMEAGNTQPINIYNCSNVTIQNIRVVGLGAATWLDNAGINIFNDTLLVGENYKITGCEVTGVGYWGIAIGMWADPGTIKIRGVEISDCLLHGNMDGLFIYGNQDHEYTVENAVISNVHAYDNLGSTAVTWTHSGSGIVVCGLLGGTVQYCKTWNNGQNSSSPDGGPYGTWMYNCNGTVIRHCESFNNKTGNGIDGGGFDIDGGCQNCVVEHSYSHNNEGPGILFYQFDGAQNPWLNNAFRFNTSFNDGRGGVTGAIMYGEVISGGIIHDNKFSFNSTDMEAVSGLITAVDAAGTLDITLARNTLLIGDDIPALPAATSVLLLMDNVVTYTSGTSWITAVNSVPENNTGQIVDNMLVYDNGTLPASGSRQTRTVYIEKSL